MPRILETVRALLLAHDFAAYRAVIDQAQTSDAYQGYGFDDQLVNALAACVSQTRSVDEATAAWLEQAPEESAALMARATFLQARGSWARGQGAAGSVTAQGWRDMHESYRAAARLWARAAQQLERPAHALAQMGCIAWIGGEQDLQDAFLPDGQSWYDWGLARQSNSYSLRAMGMNHLRPEWGGSVQEMQNYCNDPTHAQELSPVALRRFKRFAHSVLGHYWVCFTHQEQRGMDEHNAAIALEPDSAWGYYFRGLSYTVQGRHEQAVADFTRASELDGESLDILNEQVQARWRVNMHDPRLEPLLKCLMAQGWASAYVQLAGMLWRRQDWAGAVDVWRQGAQEAIPVCQEQLGLRYVDGAHGTLTPDINEAVRLLQDSINAGNSSAAAELWNLVADGKIRQPARETAVRYLLQAALQSGDGFAHSTAAYAINNYGLRYEMDNVGNITHLHFESTALQPGSADAQHYIDHLQAACDADRAWAHVELAREYFSGQYTEKDSEYAYTLLQTLFDMPSEDFGTYQARGKLLLAEHLATG